MIYTSGSTGAEGSGDCAPQCDVLLHWAREVFGAEELKGVLATTSICFDLSVFELFVPLSWGGGAAGEDALALPEWAERMR